MSYGGDNRGPLLNVIDWVFNSVALVTVILRLVSHVIIARSKNIDDGFITLAMLVNIIRAILISINVSYGYGKHIETFTYGQAVRIGRLAKIVQAIGVWTFALPKLAVVALLVQLFATSRRTTIILYSSTGLLLVISFILTILTFQQCHPIAANWNPALLETVVGAHCWDPNLFVNIGYLACYSIVLDFAYALYPIFCVSKLQMSFERKVVVSLSLSLGVIAGATTIYKMTLIKEIADNQDPTWSTTPLEVWNAVEGSTLIMAASVPLTRPVLRLMHEGFLSLPSRFSDIASKATSRRGGGSSTRSKRSWTDESDCNEGQTNRNKYEVHAIHYGARSHFSNQHVLPSKPHAEGDEFVLLESQGSSRASQHAGTFPGEVFP